MKPIKDAFVIMPFSGSPTCTELEWTEIYENIFKPSIEACGYTCARAMPMTGSLSRSIVERLHHARLVVADITDRNPNVFYELGIRHSLRKGTIITAQKQAELPSDLRGYWYLIYGIRPGEVTRFSGDVRRLIESIEASPDKSDNPVSDYLDAENVTLLSFLRSENIKKLGALTTELSGTILALERLARETSAEPTILSYDCLVLLTQTLYVDVGPELLKLAYELYTGLRSIEAGLSVVNSSFVVALGLRAVELARCITDIREKLLRDEYTEPSVVSTMIWADENTASPEDNVSALFKGAGLRCLYEVRLTQALRSKYAFTRHALHRFGQVDPHSDASDPEQPLPGAGGAGPT